MKWIGLLFLVAVLAHLGQGSALGRAKMLDSEPLEPEWAGLPDITPIWIMELEGDSAHVIHNELGVPGTLHRAEREFPLPYLLVIRKVSSDKAVRGPIEKSGLIRIRRDGTLETGAVEWVPIEEEWPGPPVVSLSRTKLMTVLSADGTTTLRLKDGSVAAELPFEVDWALCNDMARTVFLSRSQRVEADDWATRLERVIMLDYDGNVLWEEGWTDCDRIYLSSGIDRRVVWWIYEDYVEAGYYVNLIDEGRELSLGKLPGGIPSFASDGRSVLILHKNTLWAYGVYDSGTASLMWKKHLPDRIIDAAVSDGPEVVCYGTYHYEPYFVDLKAVSARTGEPLARMLSSHGAYLCWPIGFVGPYLFTGTTLHGPRSAADRKYICVFDTREVMGADW